LRQVAANAPGLVTDDDPEWVHQMRVGTRRLRSCLSLMKRFAAEAELEPLVAEVKWLAALLGDARDWDVFATETLPPLSAWFVRDASAAPGIKRVRDRAARRRREARKRAREGVASPRFQRLLLTAGLIAATPRLRRIEPRQRSGDCGRRSTQRGLGARFRLRDEAPCAPPPQVRRSRAGARARGQRRASRGAHRREAAALCRRILLAALSREAHPDLSRDAFGDAGCARPVQRRGNGGQARRRVIRYRRCRRERRRARLGRRAGGGHRARPREGAASLQRRQAVLAIEIERLRMLESAETGHKISKKDYAREEPKLREALLDAQFDLSQSGRGPVLLIISGVEGGGRGETANQLTEWMDPRYIRVLAFGPPTPEEKAHPPAWRYWQALPPKGKVGIFMNAWYNETLAQRVRGDISDDELEAQMAVIRQHERMLTDEGLVLLKFWIHLSKDAQKARMRELAKNPLTRWRVTRDDRDARRIYAKSHDLWEQLLRETPPPRRRGTSSKAPTSDTAA
jgi:polyphosphate kinase 2 (PPK2 family)